MTLVLRKVLCFLGEQWKTNLQQFKSIQQWWDVGCFNRSIENQRAGSICEISVSEFKQNGCTNQFFFFFFFGLEHKKEMAKVD